MKSIRLSILALSFLVGASALATEVTCSGERPGNEFVEVVIGKDAQDNYVAYVLSAKPGSGVVTRSFAPLEYRGGWHMYHYTSAPGADAFALVMDEFAGVTGPPVATNSTLTGPFSTPTDLLCCAANSLTYPLELCEKTAP